MREGALQQRPVQTSLRGWNIPESSLGEKTLSPQIGPDHFSYDEPSSWDDEVLFKSVFLT